MASTPGFDVYPYDASSSALTQYLPAWVQEGGVAAMRERLSDAATMDRAEADLAQGWSANRIKWLWDRVVLARTDGILGAKEGETLEAAAAKAAARRRVSRWSCAVKAATG
jgi:N-acyl-D-amino-acid deacylase